MADLLTIDDLVRLTGLEESLLRFYESEYSAEMPDKVLRGGVLFFPADSAAIFQNIHLRHGNGGRTVVRQEKYGRVIAVTSGKGGVGKSSLTLNLAVELQRLGKMSVVLDADMGLANIHLMAGLDPRYDLSDMLAGRIGVAELVASGPEGIGIIPGGGGIMSLADSTPGDRRHIINSLAEVEKAADIVLVDTGAGLGSSVREFLLAADELIFVLTPDITSLADAYGLLKVLSQQGLGGRPLYSVVNMVTTLRQAADVALRFAACADEFLGLTVRNIGYLLRDSTVTAALAGRQPYTVFRPGARVSRNTRNIAVDLLGSELEEVRVSSAFNRYLRMVANG